MEFLACFFIAAFSSLLLTPAAISGAADWGLVDLPDERKRHLRPTPLTGGVIFYPIATSALFIAYGLDTRTLSIFAGITVVTLCGLCDDLKGSHRFAKLFWQITAAALVISSGVIIDFQKMAFIHHLGIGMNGVQSVAVTLLWIVGVTNAVNLIDGLDGLAAGLSLNAFIGIGALAMVGRQSDLGLLCAIMAGGIIGYLRYNVNPARTFLGDGGSLLLGFMISVVSIMHTAKAATFLVLVIPVLFISIPMIDTIFAFFRRILNGKSPFIADREHIHHRLMDMKFSHKQTVGYFYTFSVILGCMALLLAQVQASQILAMALFCLVGMVALVKTLQIYNFNHAVARINEKLADLAVRAVGSKTDFRGYTVRAGSVLFILFLLNIFMARLNPFLSTLPVLEGAAMLLLLGLADLIISAENAGNPRGSILHMTLFLLTLLGQLELYLHWKFADLDPVHLIIMAVILLGAVTALIWHTKSFVVFLDESLEVLTLFMGIVLCALVKHFIGSTAILPFAIVMVNTVCLYIMIKMTLLRGPLRSRVYTTGAVSTTLLLCVLPWLM